MKNYGFPIVATSCNIAGEEPHLEIEEVRECIKEKVDCIIDEGKSKLGISSTIIKIKENKVIILREGPITKESIEKEI